MEAVARRYYGVLVKLRSSWETPGNNTIPQNVGYAAARHSHGKPLPSELTEA